MFILFNLIKQRRSPRQAKTAQTQIPIVVALVAVFSLSGCQQKEVLSVEATRKPAQEAPANTQDVSTKVRVWFVEEKDGKLEYVPIERSVPGQDVLCETVKELLKGPSEQEAQHGLATEIPKGTTMIDAKTSSDGVELNLSQQFSSDGGTDSIEARLEQLSRTVSNVVHDRKVFLDVEGKRLTEASGEGIEVKQPINM